MRGAVQTRSLTLAATLSALGALGCHGDGAPAPPPSDADFYSCADETRAIPYTKGMTIDSRAGTFAITLLDSFFMEIAGPRSEAPAKGTNSWTVRIADAATAQPLDGLTVVVTPRMPDHPHGTLPVVVEPLGAGSYSVAPLYLYMAGLWNVRFDIETPLASGAAATDLDAAAPAVDAADDAGATTGSSSDTATFPICIPG